MLTVQPELIWRGRIHMGDEPGIYGDAFYSGLVAELPVTLQKTDPSGPDSTILEVRTEDVQTFGGYPGHLVKVRLHKEDPANPLHYIVTDLTTERLTTADNNRQQLTVNLAGAPSPAFVSVQISVDIEVPPGLYDDFVWTRLINRSANFVFVASLGFHA